MTEASPASNEGFTESHVDNNIPSVENRQEQRVPFRSIRKRFSRATGKSHYFSGKPKETLLLQRNETTSLANVLKEKSITKEDLAGFWEQIGQNHNVEEFLSGQPAIVK